MSARPHTLMFTLSALALLAGTVQAQGPAQAQPGPLRKVPGPLAGQPVDTAPQPKNTPRTPAAGEPAPHGVSTLDGLVSGLDAMKVADRLRASTLLREYADENASAIDSLLSRPGLSAEQVEAISSVSYRSFCDRPRGAMGVQFAGLDAAGEGVAIQGAVAGFDSARVLQPGDSILSISGRPVREQAEARILIISFDPGEQVPITIRRGGEVREVLVRLGSFTQLRNSARLEQEVLRLAWEARMRRVSQGRFDPAATVDVGLDAERYLTVRTQERAEQLAASDEVTTDDSKDVGAGDGPQQQLAGSRRGVMLEANRFFALDPLAPIDRTASEMARQSDQWISALRNTQVLQRDASLPAAQRRRQEFLQRQYETTLLQSAEQRRKNKQYMLGKEGKDRKEPAKKPGAQPK